MSIKCWEKFLIFIRRQSFFIKWVKLKQKIQITNNNSKALIALIIDNNYGVENVLKRKLHLSNSKKQSLKLFVKNSKDSILTNFIKKNL